jgi:GGDEF domain-containing protein
MSQKITLLTNTFLQDKNLRKRITDDNYILSTDNDLLMLVNNIFNDPPDMFIIEQGLPGGLDVTTIHTVKNNLQFALLPLIYVVSIENLLQENNCLSLPIDDFLFRTSSIEEVITRIKLNFLRNTRISDTNPLTKLPGNTSILKLIQNNIDMQKEFTVLYLDIDNFKPFNDKYGFASGDEVIRMTARILVNNVTNFFGEKGFVGHIGGDDFVCVFPNKKIEEICGEIIKNFDGLMPLFLDEKDIEANCFFSVDRRGIEQCFPLTTISLSAIPCMPGKFNHYGEVSAVAAQIKKHLKSLTGSNYMIDRRTSYL